MHLSVPQKILDYFLGTIDRNGKSDSLRVAEDRGVDADDAAFDVEQRSA